MSLDFWRLKKFVSIHQSCCLALGINPDKYDEDDQDLFDIDGYGPIRETLDNGLYEHISNESGSGFYFNDETILKSESPDGNYSFELSLVLVKRLLRRESIASTFYDAIEDRSTSLIPLAPHHYDVEEKQLRKAIPFHEAKLLKILDETLNEFYGDDFASNPDKKNRYIKKDFIVNWLETKYELSNIQAKAIYTVSRY